MRRALITGVSGQDGSYLAELLLGKGYEVWGVIRRSSSPNTRRVDHLREEPQVGGRLRLVYGDLTDGSALARVVREARPDEIYNLAAQSHVRVSFDVPEHTADVGALGVVRLLEAVRESGLRPRIYQASSSELFGSSPPPQSESTPFRPRSPYAAAKLMAYWTVVNYREAYGMHASNGILFNHESCTADTPVVVRRNGLVDILPIEEIVPHHEAPKPGDRLTTAIDDLEVWDRGSWTPVTCATASWCESRRVTRVRARSAIFQATDDHVAFKNDGTEVPVGQLFAGDRLALCTPPRVAPDVVGVDLDEAWLLGVMAADGHVSRGGSHGRVTKNDQKLLDEVAEIWTRVTGGYTTRGESRSGYSDKTVSVVNLCGACDYLRAVRAELYTAGGFKRIPRRVLNTGREAQLAFLRGYNRGDGLKEGYGAYEFKSWKTNSATLAAGLWWVAHAVLGQRMTLWTEDRDGATYYAINLNSPQESDRGAHLRRPQDEVVGVDRSEYTGWTYDLATASGTFHAGVGSGWIHNSPRRGETFVTRKVTRAAARIALGLQERLYLGNLDASRDWGHARDYVEAMWLMTQRDEPGDYVVATGESHTVRELLDEAFGRVGLDWRTRVEADQRLLRPTEVDALRGDASKARRELGWAPRTTFRELVAEMVDADLEAEARLAR